LFDGLPGTAESILPLANYRVSLPDCEGKLPMKSWLFPLAALFCAAGPVTAADPPPSPVIGLWEGPIKVGAVELRLGFKIAAKDDSTFAATMDSIDQGARGISAEKVSFADKKLTIEMPKIKAEFAGTLADDGNVLKGEWKQAGVNFPLELKRVEKFSTVARPQTPKKPYPYAEEEVTFENKVAEVKLAGTLTKPKGDGPFRCAVLITGSGPQDRDETLLGHKPFLVLADSLTRKGIAVLRYDDRGVGQSTGDFAKATSADFAGDVRAAVRFLRGRKDIDAKGIGLIGHSEGGLIAPIVAADDPEIAFIVLLAGPGLPGDELLLLQGEALLTAIKADEKKLKWQRDMQTKIFKLVKEGADAKALKAALEEAFAAIPEEERKKAAAELDKISEGFLSTAWLRYFLAADPRTFLKKVRCPVLALNGEKDVQVPAKVNLEAIAKALKEGGNTKVTTRELPGLNHLFQTCKTGLPAEYGRIEETIAPAALDLIGEWVTNLK
jgi:pimeloyl-ACP methyl ester carboxylesterase